MEFRAKIKSTMPPIRGSRLVPSASSIQEAHTRFPYTQLTQTDSNIYRSNQSLGVTQIQQISTVRPALRYTTHFMTERPTVQRISLNQSVSYSQSGADSDRSSRCQSAVEYQTTSASRLIPTVDGFNPDSVFQYSQNLAPKDIADFKQLLITRVDSYESKLPENTSLSGRSHLKKIQENDEKQQNQKPAFTKINQAAFWERMYRQIKDKYCKLEIQSRDLRDKFRQTQVQKDKLQENCNNYLKELSLLKEEKQNKEQNWQGMENTIKEVKNSNIKLEESLRISRNIIANLNDRLDKQDKRMSSMLLYQDTFSEQAWKRREEELIKTVTESQMQKNEQIIKNLNSTNFELKLKLIDEGIIHDEALQKLKITMKEKHSLQIQILLKQIADLQEYRQSFLKTLENQSIKQLQISLELDAKSREIDILNAELAKLDELNIQLDAKVVALLSENKNIGQIISELSREIHHLSNDKLQLFQEKEAIVHFLNERDNQIQQLILRQSTKSLEICAMQKQIDLDKQKIQSLQFVVQETKKEVDHLKVEIECQKQQYIGIIALKQIQNKQSIQIQKSANDQLTQKLQNLEQKVIDSRQTYEKELQVKKLELQSSKDEHQLILTKIKQEKQLLSKRISAFQDQIDSTDAQLLEKDVQINELRSLITKLREEIALVKQEAAIREQSNRKKQEQITLKNIQIVEFQAEYRHILEGEIKKISSLYQSASNEIERQMNSPPRQLEEKQESPKLSPNNNIELVCDAIQLEAAFQQEKEELLNRIEQLTFLNNALKEQLEYFNEMEKNTNNLVMKKIKSFEQNMERIQSQKNELEDKNSDLTLQIVSLNAKALFYDGKIEWLEQIYKDLEINLQETTEELLKLQASFVNYRLSKKYEELFYQEQATGKLMNEVQSVQQTCIPVESVNQPIFSQEYTLQEQNIQIPSENLASNPESSKILQNEQLQTLQLKLMIIEKQDDEFAPKQDFMKSDSDKVLFHESDEEQANLLQQDEQNEQNDELMIEQSTQLISNDEQIQEQINDSQDVDQLIDKEVINSEIVELEEQVQVLPSLQNKLVLENSASN